MIHAGNRGNRLVGIVGAIMVTAGKGAAGRKEDGGYSDSNLVHFNLLSHPLGGVLGGRFRWR